MPERRTLNRTYSVGDQVPTCPVFTRAKIKSRFGILVDLPSQFITMSETRTPKVFLYSQLSDIAHNVDKGFKDKLKYNLKTINSSLFCSGHNTMDWNKFSSKCYKEWLNLISHALTTKENWERTGKQDLIYLLYYPTVLSCALVLDRFAKPYKN